MNELKLKTALRFLFFVLLIAGPLMASADASTSVAPPARMSKAELEDYNSHYPSLFQFSFLGGMSFGDMSGPAAYGDSAESYKMAALIDMGRGAYSVESGVEFLAFPTAANLHDPNELADDQKYRVNSQWIGIPLVAKYNYIEHPQASLSFKLGIMPATMLTNPDVTVFASQGADSTTMYGHVNTFDLFGVTGITGVAPINDWASFVLDATFYYGTTDADGYGAHNKALFVSAGFRFNL